MAFEIVHRIDKAVVALLKAPLDLELPEERRGQRMPKSAAPRRHRSLYDRYLADFPPVLAASVAWWEAMLDAHLEDEDVSREEAVDMAYDEQIAGPAQAPEAVSHVRRYWLACDELNRAVLPEQRVAPEWFLVGWFGAEEGEDYVRLLSCMPYWPIGLDENGNWC